MTGLGGYVTVTLEQRARYAVGRLPAWFGWTELAREIAASGGPQISRTHEQLRDAVTPLLTDGTITEPTPDRFAKRGAPPRYLATFQPQVWIDDEAIDCDSPTAEWDVTAVLSSFERTHISREIDAGEDSVLALDEAPRLLAALDREHDAHTHASIHPYNLTIRRLDAVTPEAVAE